MTDVPTLPFVAARDFHTGRLRPVRLVVVHDMEAPQGATTAENVAAYFGHPDSPSSTHLCVDENSAVRCVHDDDTAWGAPGANADGWQVEHAGMARQTRADWLTAANLAMLGISAKAAAARIHAWGWTATEVRHLTDAQIADGHSRGFVGHRDITRVLNDGQGHTDPGVDFPWDTYLALVQRELALLDPSEEDDMTPDQAKQLTDTAARVTNLERWVGGAKTGNVMQRLEALEDVVGRIAKKVGA